MRVDWYPTPITYYNGYMRIFVTVKPRAREESVERVGEHEYVVKVSAPPKDGKANRAVEKLLAEYFGVPTSRVTIVSGHASRRKVVAIDN